MEKKKKQIIVTISLVVVLILAVIGVSYAAFSYVGKGEKVNQITTGTISMDYLESDNVISINNALPTTDETGKVRLRDGEYFDFSITTTLNGNATINFEIAAEDFDDNTFDGANVKFHLTKIVGSEEVEVSSNLPSVYNEQTGENKKTGRPAGMMSLLTGSTSTQGEETTNYRLRLYVDEAYNPQGDGGGLIFKTRINVYGKVAMVGEPIMKNTGYESYMAGDYIYSNNFDEYGGYELNGSVTSIVIKDNLLVPNTALTNWDLSEAGDKSVIAYLENDGVNDDNTINYKLSIGGNGGVIAPVDSSMLFASAYLGNMTKVDLSHLDTSFVQDMSFMFWGMRVDHLDLSMLDTSKVIDMTATFSYCNISDLNLEGLDTLKVTNMSQMFEGSGIVNVNLEHLNTFSVTDMSRMFRYCSSTYLDLSSFDTSKVIYMRQMFSYCQNLTEINLLGKFNTSNVKVMKLMFNQCSSLEQINLSNFDTSSVTDMSSMFVGCSSLTSLDLTNFDTSKVENMSGMFSFCSGLTSLDLTSFDTSALSDSGAITSSTTAEMFRNCTNLTSILVSSKWDRMSAYYMFEGCGCDHVTIV